jgi:hypothetical protein
MILTLAWKEYREQRAVWVTMVVVGALLLTVLPAVTEPGERMLYVIALLAVAATAGLVSGAMLLAGEAESGTLTYLDTQPALRPPIWRAKVVAGALLCLPQGLALAGVAVSLRVLPAAVPAEAWFAVVPAVTLEGFAWGLFGSALCRNVLSAVGVGLLPLALNWLLGPPSWPLTAPTVVTRAFLVVAALCLSAVIFCGADLQRRSSPRVRTRPVRRPRPAGPAVSSSWRALLWLSARQGRRQVLVLCGLAVLVGLFLPGGGWPLWLGATLFVGVLCGTGTFAAEQDTGAHRFLASQRLPLGRLWGIRLGFWAAAALVITLLMVLGLVLGGTSAEMNQVGGPARGQGRAWVHPFFAPEWVPTGLWYFPAAGLVSGFAIAQLFTLLWRKGIVTVVLSVLVSAGVLTVWLPSLVSGGLPAWQFLLVPLLLLIAGRLLVRDWLCERLFTARSPLILALAGVLAALATAAALAFRAVEVPDAGLPFDVKEFEAGLPPPEQNAAGMQLRQALSRMAEVEKLVTAKLEPPEDGPGVRPPANLSSALGKYRELLDRVRERGWASRLRDLSPQAAPGRGAELEPWLDEMFRGDWAADLGAAARLPLGVLQDPRHVTTGQPLPAAEQGELAARLLTARALQLQARGESRAALEQLAVVLALSRQLRHKAVTWSYRGGLLAEQTALEGLDRWLEQLGRKPDLLRSALEELNHHEAAVPPLTDAVKADYLLVRNGLFTPPQLTHGHGWGGGPEERFTAEAVALAQQTPWEKERTQRIVNAVFAGWLRGAEAAYGEVAPTLTERWDGWHRGWTWASLRGWLPPCDPARGPTREEMAELLDGSWLGLLEGSAPGLRLQPLATSQSCRLRGHRLILALALYQAEQGKPAAALADLVPRYLPELPADPFSGEPFRYRVSAGEQVRWRQAPREWEQEFRAVPAGQGIVWGVGPDQIDNGGKAQGDGGSLSIRGREQRGLDVIFLVPRWPEP